MKKSLFFSLLLCIGVGSTTETAAQQLRAKVNRNLDQTAQATAGAAKGIAVSQAEMVEKRAQNVKHFSNSDGSYTAQIGGNYHYKDSKGMWQDINLNIQTEGSGFKNVTNHIKSYFPKAASDNSGVSIRLENGDRFVYWKNPQLKMDDKVTKAASGSASVQGEKLTYHNIYNKISEEFVVLQNGIENNIILQSKTPEISNLSSTSAMEFSHFIPLQNGWKVRDAKGQHMTSSFSTDNFSIQMSNQESNIYFGKVIVFDSSISKDEAMKLHFPQDKLSSTERIKVNNHAKLLSYQIKFVDGGIEVSSSLPTSWLQTANRSYPVTIDPEVTITPTGATGNFYGPLTHWYGYQRHATVYLQSEIGVYGTITDIEYNSTNAGTAGSRPTKVYMKTTPSSALATGAWNSPNYIGGAQLCLDASTDQGNTPGWKKLTLTTPYNYSQDNLMIMVYDAWGGTGAAKYYNQANSATYTNRQAHRRADTTDPGDASSLLLENKVSEIRLTYVPSAECTTLPAAVTAISSVSSTCAGAPFSLTASGLPIESGLSVQWQQSTDGGGTWTNLGTAQVSGTYNVTAGITVNTQYRALITCVPSQATVTSSVVIVTIKPAADCYCTNTIPFICSDGDLITNVTIGTINNNSGCDTNGYSNYTATVAPADLQAGSTVPVSVTVGPSGDGWLYESVGVWIDYNRNGVFEESELTAIGVGLNEPILGNIAIPSTALQGLTRMRVVVKAAINPLTGADACGPVNANESYGEMEDYMVNITPPMAVNTVNAMSAVQLYPNPATTEVFVELGSLKKGSLEIFTADGRLVSTHQLSAEVNKLNVSRLAPGTYVVKITSPEGTVTRKLMKK